MYLDDIDKQILKELFRNGRTSLTNFDIKMDQKTMSHTGVKKRITKLEDSGIPHVQGNISISKLNYKAMFILLEMKNYDELKFHFDNVFHLPL